MYITGAVPITLAAGVLLLVFAEPARLNPWLVLLAWVVLVGVVTITDAVLAASPHGLRFDRSIPAKARLLEQVPTKLYVTNPTARTIRATIRDAWQPTAGAPADREKATVPAGERRELSLMLRPRRRGEIRSEFLTVRIAGPLGLAGRQANLPVGGALRVLPPFNSRRHLPSRLQRLKEMDGTTTLQVRGQGTEFDSLREYVRGDDIRSIDWRATARAGSTMLRTWRPERDRHVVVLIDTGRTAAARVGDGTRLDASMEATLLVSALAQRAGDHVHLLMFDRRVRAQVSGIDGPPLLPALTDAMATVEAELIDTDWDAAFTQVRKLHSRPSLLVVLTAQDEVESSRDFLGSLAMLPRETRLVVGSASDDSLSDIVSAREDIDAVYRAAAAAQTIREARVVARAVERAGGDAISASAEDLPPRVADRYLELKKQGRL